MSNTLDMSAYCANIALGELTSWSLEPPLAENMKRVLENMSIALTKEVKYIAAAKAAVSALGAEDGAGAVGQDLRRSSQEQPAAGAQIKGSDGTGAVGQHMLYPRGVALPDDWKDCLINEGYVVGHLQDNRTPHAEA
ncbi:hypothetical protein CYMTET_46893 [Cymbomonas tetramitiformis]|uniref:Uncharacterized protein n=1 Tax=Cymbomonas tetramitiformis TaxID=36881 RepID=A0AAE0BX70_9CHLO|nr:hypothetical protein CYMTET_46893 [Cymbomonas tetramitiformis]|eukprot:gene1731-2391_t